MLGISQCPPTLENHPGTLPCPGVWLAPHAGT